MNTITQSVVSVNLEEARAEVAQAGVRAYGAERAYAKALNEHFATLSVAWYEVEHTDKGAEAELVHAEKRALFKELHSAHPTGKYPNPSVPYGRIRKYGKEENDAMFTVIGDDGQSASTEEGEGGGARHTRSLTLRYTEDLSSLFKAGKRAERDGLIQTKEAQALTHIASALGALGIDISQL